MKKIFSYLTLRNNLIIGLTLCLLIKQPISLLFKLLGINNYFFLFCGLFSGLVTYTKIVANNETSSKKSLYLSIATGGFVSLFSYYLSLNNLMEFIISLHLGFSLILENFPIYSYIFSANFLKKIMREKLSFWISGKLSLNKPRLIEVKKNFHFTGGEVKKITPVGNGSCQLPGSPNQTITHLSERPSGNQPNSGGFNNNPQWGSSLQSNSNSSQPGLNQETMNKYPEIPRNFNYKLFAEIHKEKAEVIFLEREQGLNTDGIKDKTITMLELGITEKTLYYKVLKKFAEEYKGDNKVVKNFCTSIFTDRPVKIKMFDSNSINSKIFDAISNHK